jgi:GT2 family glycosyltransferase
MKNLTISIVNYNSGEYLTRCLESIKLVEDEAKIKTIVVDNNSTDESLETAKQQFPKVEFIDNKDNIGFGKAHNQVLKKLDSEFVLLLNPDCILEKGVIKKLIEYIEKNPDTGVITCKIILPDGSVDLTAHRGLPTPWASLLYFFGDNSKYHLTNRDLKNPHEVDSISGAFFLTKKEVLEKSGLFDEKFFLYGEDIDLSVRIHDAGFKVIYYPDVSITHYKGVSSGLKQHSQDITRADSKTKLRAVNAFYEAMFIFYDKHFKEKYFFLINWLVYLGIYLRWALALLKKTV